MENVVVLKFGGSSLATPTLIKKAALRVKSYSDQGDKVIVIVSAMGKTTDQLTELAYEVSSNPNRRELDLLVSTGERVSMTLLSMALVDLECDAISFTGSQAGILTCSNYNEATIKDLKPIRVAESLAQGKIVVVAGFQGVDPNKKEVTTLGRGGSDITAIAFANYFNAKECLFLKDVQGVFSADPNLIPEAIHLPLIKPKFLKTLCQWGSKVIHPSCVDYAMEHDRIIKIGHSHIEDLPTTETSPKADEHIFAITSYNEVLCFQSPLKSNPWLEELESAFTNVLYFNNGHKNPHYLLTPESRSKAYYKVLEKNDVSRVKSYSLVTLVAPTIDYVDLQQLLGDISIGIIDQFTTESSFHFVVPQESCIEFIAALHSMLFNAKQ